MKSTAIPLWITLSQIRLNLSLHVFQKEGAIQTDEGNDTSDILGYEISGIGELSRIIEVNIKTQEGSKTEVEHFSELLVSLRPHRKGVKKHSEYFIYSKENNAYKIYKNQLTLYLVVPELTFNKFCKQIASKNIHNIMVGISLNGEQDSSVGAFGPPSVDDIVSIKADDFRFDSNVKLASLVANIHIRSSKEAGKNNEYKP